MIDVVRLLEVLQIEVDFERGGELWANCPNPHHEEKTPSWSIRATPDHPKYGFHKCFGCGFSGGPITLIAAVEGITRSGARGWVQRQGITVEDRVSLKVFFDNAPPKYDFMVLPPQVKGVGVLKLWPKPFREFAAKRGLTEEQIQRWGIGYAVDGKLSMRVVFPVFDEHGAMQSYSARAIFAGRDMPTAKPGRPAAKYLTASRKEGADHAGVFGAFRWPEVGRRRRVYVTEGVLNALAIERVLKPAEREQDGIGALDGSELLDGQVLALGSFEEIVVVSDPDIAGDKLHDALSALARWKTVRRVTIPEGEDANSLEPDTLRGLLDGEPKHSDRSDVPLRSRSSAKADRGSAGDPPRKPGKSRARSRSSSKAALPHRLPRRSLAGGRTRKSEAEAT